MEYTLKSYYKVCSRINNKLHGSFLITPTSRFYLIYELNKITWAPLGSPGILVFGEYYQARLFGRTEEDRNATYIILEGKAVLPVRKNLLVAGITVRGPGRSGQEGEILCFMHDSKRGRLPPDGTYACPGFLPEGEIKDD